MHMKLLTMKDYRLLRASRGSYLVAMLANFLCELSVLSLGLARYPPSMIAATAVYASRRTCHLQQPWSPTLEASSGLTFNDLQDCIELFNEFYGSLLIFGNQQTHLCELQVFQRYSHMLDGNIDLKKIIF